LAAICFEDIRSLSCTRPAACTQLHVAIFGAGISLKAALGK
jgi:hypothetical protein